MDAISLKKEEPRTNQALASSINVFLLEKGSTFSVLSILCVHHFLEIHL